MREESGSCEFTDANEDVGEEDVGEQDQHDTNQDVEIDKDLEWQVVGVVTLCKLMHNVSLVEDVVDEEREDVVEEGVEYVR